MTKVGRGPVAATADSQLEAEIGSRTPTGSRAPDARQDQPLL
jgi:hypothetical protein